jgi:hypothetical protein
MPFIARSITKGDNDAKVLSEAAEFSIIRKRGKLFVAVISHSFSIIDAGDL